MQQILLNVYKNRSIKRTLFMAAKNSSTLPQPHPLFDTLESLSDTPPCVANALCALNIAEVEHEYRLCLEFLKSYAKSSDTFNAYRREVERFLQWAWLVCKQPIKKISRNEFREFLEFISAPPKAWIGIKNVSRFVFDIESGLRVANPEWRPFVAKTSKIERRHGKTPSKNVYQLGNKSIEAIFGCLSSLFSFLQQESYLEANPVLLIRQKKGYIQSASQEGDAKIKSLAMGYGNFHCRKNGRGRSAA